MNFKEIKPLEFETDYEETKKLIDKLNLEVAKAVGLPRHYFEFYPYHKTAMDLYFNKVLRPVVQYPLKVI